jgi:hypothetical protein
VLRVGTSKGSKINQHGCSTSGVLATEALQKEEEEEEEEELEEEDCDRINCLKKMIGSILIFTIRRMKEEKFV